ncbi:MAG: DUF2231 domain-containing protein [Planctomycetota bacterium]
MIDFIYETLSGLGFDHPLHPIAVHIPMGMIVGGFLFGLLGLKMEQLTRTAHYCFSLALVFIVPTIITGIMDWQYRMVGHWSSFIVAKLILASTLTVLLALSVWFGYKKTLSFKSLLVLYGLCVMNAGGLGYIGGELSYG